MTGCWWKLVTVLSVCAGVSPALAQETTPATSTPARGEDTQEQLVAEISGNAKDAQLAAGSSVDGPRVAWRAKRAGGWQVFVDGKPRAEFQNVEAMGFSPDGRRLACSVKRQGKWWTVVLEPDDTITTPATPSRIFSRPVFSPDGRRLAYRSGYGLGKMGVVVDDQLVPVTYWTLDDPVFSPDSKRVAFLVEDHSSYRMVVDGTPSERFGLPIMTSAEIADYAGTFVGRPVFSPDSRHIAFVSATTLVIDMAEQTELRYADIGGVAFGANGRSHAYNAQPQRQGKWTCVVDGHAGPEFDAVSPPIYSSDGNHLAYVAMNNGRLFEVIDGARVRDRSVERKPVAHRPYSQGGGGGLAGTLLAGAMSNDIIFAEQLTFSPSGQRLAYVVVSGGGQYAKWNTKRARRRAVVDGNEGKEYDVERLHDLRFSDDSLHVAYVVHDIKTAAGDKAVVVVDQLEGKSYDDVFCESVSFSADGKKLTYVAREGQKILRVTQAY